jgi:hypothetical protein
VYSTSGNAIQFSDPARREALGVAKNILEWFEATDGPTPPSLRRIVAGVMRPQGVLRLKADKQLPPLSGASRAPIQAHHQK